jgi:hypothetical protein
MASAILNPGLFASEGAGTATTFAPAALAERTPAKESSKAIHSWGGSPELYDRSLVNGWVRLPFGLTFRGVEYREILVERESLYHGMDESQWR